MKQLSVLYFTLLSFCVLAQNKEVHPIKIYLEDAETGKNVSDAKVTLEGFEIRAITGKYDKTGKYYCFDKIPAGYNTIMAYHKKYNEKGFQDVKGLPKEVKLRLYNQLNVSYSFESDTYHESSQNIYVEDPYKLAIFSNDIKDYNLFKDYLYLEIKKLNLDIEVVNPYFELEKNKNIPYIFRRFVSPNQKEYYPYIDGFEVEDDTNYFIPLTKGYSSSEYFSGTGSRGRPIEAKDTAFYFRKKNGRKFKRFNDPILKKIRSINGITTAAVLYNKYSFNDEKGRENYKNSFSKKLDRRNNFKNIDTRSL